MPKQGVSVFENLYELLRKRTGLPKMLSEIFIVIFCGLLFQVASGCKLEIVDDQGYTPLIIACFNADENLLEVSILCARA